MKKTVLSMLLLFLISGMFFVNAEDWRKKYKEISFGVITGENEQDRTARYAGVKEFIEKKLGVKVNWRTATDYAGIIEGIRTKKLELALFGPASYAECYKVTNGKIKPILGSLDQNGELGYHSIIIVKKDSPYQKIEDLKGKKIGWADPNSTSGFQAPVFYMATKMKIDPDKFFASQSFSGSHENSVIGLLNGTFDAIATTWTSETNSNPLRMEEKKMIEPGQWRILWKSPKLPSSPWVVPTWLPVDMQKDLENAMIKIKDEAPDAWQKLTDGKVKSYVPVKHSDYKDVIDMLDYNQKARKLKG